MPACATTDRRMLLTITGTLGLSYAMKRATDLVTWPVASNRRVTSPAATFTETQIQSNASRRFYRARQTGDAP